MATTRLNCITVSRSLCRKVLADPRSPNAGMLFAGVDSRLHVANLTFEATGQLYPLGYVLSAEKYTSVSIRATREYTYAIIDGDEANPAESGATTWRWGICRLLRLPKPSAAADSKGRSGTCD
ncbi:hypothetical protein LXA43DRAFT_459072 [Ganoderma leucocontextum]|nr:hypothetical protein LXA43DRAFT_459072 [Ganoderma leucocontextum]